MIRVFYEVPDPTDEHQHLCFGIITGPNETGAMVTRISRDSAEQIADALTALVHAHDAIAEAVKDE